jgi:addiction module RelE/StbE family toxin
MKYGLNITSEAVADVEDARSTIAESSAQAAERFTDLMDRSFESLTFLPNRHPLAPEAATHGRDIRQMVVGKYRIVYTVVYQVVNVLRVRHGARRPFKPGELN